MAFYGVDTAIFDFLHNTHMVGLPVLAADGPIENDNIAWLWLIAVILPQPTPLEPWNPLRGASRELRDHSSVNIAALVGVPRDKTSAPFHAGIESIPRPFFRK